MEIDRRRSIETELTCLRTLQPILAKPRKPDSISRNQSSNRDVRSGYVQ